MKVVMFTEPEINSFVLAYIKAMLWSTSGTMPDGQEIESLEEFEISESARAAVESDCRAFLATYDHKFFMAFCRQPYYSLEKAGQDFWLTRARHGVGFWDRGLGTVGEELTDAAHSFGEVWPYIGDDGLVYID